LGDGPLPPAIRAAAAADRRRNFFAAGSGFASVRELQTTMILMQTQLVIYL
jgi:hypothetical protein